MTETSSNVYDIFQPSPISLKELSAIAVSLEIWRCEVNKYRRSCTLNNFRASSERITLKTLLPNLPSQIYNTIAEYVAIFGHSMNTWLMEHYTRVFHFHHEYTHMNSVLRDFDDFVCDYDGDIHYARTAGRMMRCVRFDSKRKFVIACTYFFEDDIRRLWPYVSENMRVDNTNLNGINFKVCPQLYYWICHLRKKSDKPIPVLMLEYGMPYNRPSVEYFWNRVPPETQIWPALNLLQRNLKSFLRFILQKLSVAQLRTLDNYYHNIFVMHHLLSNRLYNEGFVLRTWSHIGNIISKSNFTTMVKNMLEIGPMGLRTDHEECREPENWAHLCCEIWNNSSHDFKRSAIKNILSDGASFVNVRVGARFSRDVELLLAILSYASLPERKSFWRERWPQLIVFYRTRNLHRIMEMCFECAEEMNQLKGNVMFGSDKVSNACVLLIYNAEFDELNDLVGFLKLETQTARLFKQQLLQLAKEHFRFSNRVIQRIREFNEFINDAYDSDHLSDNFKNQFGTLPAAQALISCCIQLPYKVPLDAVVEFIDTFVLDEDTLMRMKTRVIDSLRRGAKSANYRPTLFNMPWFTSVLLWCLGSDEEVEKFKSEPLL